jgi:hypothetical protein
VCFREEVRVVLYKSFEPISSSISGLLGGASQNLKESLSLMMMVE